MIFKTDSYVTDLNASDIETTIDVDSFRGIFLNDINSYFSCEGHKGIGYFEMVSIDNVPGLRLPLIFDYLINEEFRTVRFRRSCCYFEPRFDVSSPTPAIFGFWHDVIGDGSRRVYVFRLVDE